jgi:hypothetical protein
MAIARVLRWVVAAMGVALAILVVTGLYLTWNSSPFGTVGWVHAHRVASSAFVLLGLSAAHDPAPAG